MPHQPRSESTSAARVRTVCFRCDGDGAVAIRRACLLAEFGPPTYDVRICPQCLGREWLSGLVLPS